MLFHSTVYCSISLIYWWSDIEEIVTLDHHAYISQYLLCLKLSVQIGFLLSVPRLPSMVEKKDFEMEGLDFLACSWSYLMITLFTHFCDHYSIYTVYVFFYVCVWASFFQTTGSTTAAREPGSSTSSSETCTATLEVFYFHPQNSHITGVFLTFFMRK